MAEPRKSVKDIRAKPSGKDLKGSRKSIAGLSLEHVAGSKADKNRRRKSVASQFAHPLTGETVKERQVRKIEFKKPLIKIYLQLVNIRTPCYLLLWQKIVSSFICNYRSVESDSESCIVQDM